MTARALQTAVAALLLDPARRAAFARGERNPPELSVNEHQQLADVVRSAGMDAARRMHLAFRLTKLLAGLPKTCEALGPDALAREAQQFWATNPPRAFFYAAEAMAFAQHLRGRLAAGLAVPGLAEALEEEVHNGSCRQNAAPGVPAS